MKTSSSYIRPNVKPILFAAFLLFGLFSCSSSENDLLRSSCPTTASFSVQYNSCDEGCSVTFINSSTNAVSYNWNFGDGTTGTGKNPIRQYSQGFYQVTLKAIGENCTAEYIGTVDVIIN